MNRTQIYLTKSQRDALQALAVKYDCSSSELIREAIEQYLSRKASSAVDQLFEAARGIWSDRADDGEFRRIRESLERDF